MQNGTPIHVQLENLIRGKIADGTYPTNSPLPSERKMAEAYGINRLTVRAALKNLQKEGLVRTEHGKGNFVSSVKIKLNFSTISGFGAQLKEQGVAHTNQVLLAEELPAGYIMSQNFNVEKGTPLFHLVRVRIGNGNPLAIDDTYILYDEIPRVASIDFETASLYQKLKECGNFPEYARQTLYIQRIYGKIAEVMALEDDTPVFCIIHQAYSAKHALIEYTLSYVNPTYSSVASCLRK